jgi:sulfite reductase (ferredoxin)
MQNIIILDIPESQLTAFKHDAAGVGFVLDGTLFQRSVISCTGSQYCKLAVVETKQFSLDLARQLDETLVPQLATASSAATIPVSHVHALHESSLTTIGGLRVHVTGCPNACGQHYIAGIGLQGVQVPAAAGGTTDGFDVFIGGGLGQSARFARRIGYRTEAAQVPRSLQRLVMGYVDDRDENETFTQWVIRVGDAHVKTLLAGPLVDGS